jgi:hypothetical protein
MCAHAGGQEVLEARVQFSRHVSFCRKGAVTWRLGRSYGGSRLRGLVIIASSSLLVRFMLFTWVLQKQQTCAPLR